MDIVFSKVAVSVCLFTPSAAVRENQLAQQHKTDTIHIHIRIDCVSVCNTGGCGGLRG